MVPTQNAGLRVLAFGECMLELQGTAFGTMQQSYGGDTYNTAVYLARCGARMGLQVDYATALGDDGLSQGLLQRWQADGVGTSLVRQLPGRMPGLYLIEVDASGERHFSYWRDQAAARSYFDTDVGETPLEQQLGSAQALHFSGISLAILPPQGRQRLLQAAARVRAQGGLVSFDNNYRPRLWSSRAEAQAAFVGALQVATLALMSLDDEQALWDNGDAASQLQRTLAAPCAEVVVKRGALSTLVRCAGYRKGSEDSDSGRPHVTSVPTEAVAHVLDTTAAGDSFAGAYLAARLGGTSAVQAAAAGNRLAALVVQHRGAIVPEAVMKDLMTATPANV